MNKSWAIILVVALGSMILRYLPFIIFSNNKRNPMFIRSLGNNLPLAAIGLLVIYCLKDISFISGSYGIPEIISILFIVISYYKTKNNLISIFGGTFIYLLLVNLVFY